MPRLFSYGSLRESRVQLTAFGRLLEGQADELPGFELARAPRPDMLASGAEAWVYVDSRT